MRQFADMMPMGGDIGGHQHAQLATLLKPASARVCRLALLP